MSSSDSEIVILVSPPVKKKPALPTKSKPTLPAAPHASSSNNTDTAPSPPTAAPLYSSVEPGGVSRPRPKRVGRSIASLEGRTKTEKARRESGKGKERAHTLPRGALVHTVQNGSDTSDELDDFFTKKAVTPRPLRRFETKGKAVVAVSSSPSSRSSSLEPDDDNAGARPKPLSLPLWTRGASGADKKIAAAGGPGKNRRKKRRGESTDEETRNRDRIATERWNGKAKVYADSDDDSSGSLEQNDADVRKRGRRRSDRSRSKSLTPPAPVDEYRLAAALNSIRENLAPHQLQTQSLVVRNALTSGADDEDPDETLLHDAENVELRAGESKDEGPLVTITVSLAWDPDKPASERARNYHERPVPYELGVKTPFGRMFRRVSENHPGIGDAIEDELIFTYQRRRVYGFATPYSLKILVSAAFKCYSVAVFEKLNAEGAAADLLREVTPARAEESDNESLPVVSRGASAIGGVKDSLPTGALFKISIRGSPTMVLPLAVKPTTTIGQLLKSYCKKFGIDDSRRERMWLEYDGDKLDRMLAISMYDDIEEEETIDVREAKA